MSNNTKPQTVDDVMDELDSSLQSPAVSAHHMLEKAIRRHANLDFFRGMQVA